MKVLLCGRISDELQDVVLCDQIVYRPDLEKRDDRFLVATITAVRPDVLITKFPVSQQVLGVWRNLRPTESLFVIEVGDADAGPEQRPDHIVVCRVAGPTVPLSAFQLAERHYTARATAASLPSRKSRSTSTPTPHDSVIVVGAGIVGLMVALDLARSGRRVSVVDSGPDPRTDHGWSRFGCTRGGENARMLLHRAESSQYRPAPDPQPDRD